MKVPSNLPHSPREAQCKSCLDWFWDTELVNGLCEPCFNKEEQMKFTTEFMDKLIEWQKAGRRCVTITLESEDMASDPIKIWCYDYDQMNGVHIKKLSELPSAETLKQKKREALEKQLKEMEA